MCVIFYFGFDRALVVGRRVSLFGVCFSFGDYLDLDSTVCESVLYEFENIGSPHPIFGIKILVMLLSRACPLTFSSDIRRLSNVGFPKVSIWLRDCIRSCWILDPNRGELNLWLSWLFDKILAVRSLYGKLFLQILHSS